MTREKQQRETYECMRCGVKLTEEEYETYGGLCEDCYEIEVDELDFEDEYNI